MEKCCICGRNHKEAFDKIGNGILIKIKNMSGEDKLICISCIGIRPIKQPDDVIWKDGDMVLHNIH